LHIGLNFANKRKSCVKECNDALKAATPADEKEELEEVCESPADPDSLEADLEDAVEEELMGDDIDSD